MLKTDIANSAGGGGGSHIDLVYVYACLLAWGDFLEFWHSDGSVSLQMVPNMHELVFFIQITVKKYKDWVKLCILVQNWLIDE